MVTSDSSELRYSVINRGLRPARVVIIFDGDGDWSYWARRALFLAGRVWGGAGFALVPHHNGVVDPALLRASRAYDPDYVVVFNRTVAEQEHFAPGSIVFRDEEERPADDDVARAARVAEAAGVEVGPGAGAMEARDLVARACSPYRLPVGDERVEDVQFYECPSPEFPAAETVPGAHSGHVLHCPPAWGGLIGAAVASHAGVAVSPELGGGEPDLDQGFIWQIIRWLSDCQPRVLPYELLWFPNGVATSVLTEDSERAHLRTMAGLTSVHSAGVEAWPAVAVLGDTAEDFALARLIQLTYGRAIWLPSPFGVDADQLASPLVAGLVDLATRSGLGAPRSLLLTSTSRSVDNTFEFEKRLRDSDVLKASSRLQTDGDWTLGPDDIQWTRTGTTHLAIHEQFDDILSIPTLVGTAGCREMATVLPAPLLDDHKLAAHSDIAWHVDITWTQENHVRGRGVLGEHLLAPETSPHLTLVRNNCRGVSYRAKRFDFVVAGIQSVNKLARPALRHLSLRAFIDAKAAERGLATRVSSAGQRTSQLTRMAGGRSEFTDLFGGKLLPALRALQPRGNNNDAAYPAGDGVILRASEGALTFDGIRSRVDAMDVGDVRDLVDAATRAGILRRGLILRCQVCQTKQLQTVDALGQSWTCQRCDDSNDLNRHAWHHATNEPTWFYELHPVGHHLLNDHGDVPALLAKYLSRGSGTRQPQYEDVMEIEFLQDSSPQAEVDLIAYLEDTLIVAECKSSRSLGETAKRDRQAEIHKKCRVASWLQADVVIFATTAPEWRSGIAESIRGYVQSFDGWAKRGRPDLHLITGLGGTSVSTEIVRPWSRRRASEKQPWKL